MSSGHDSHSAHRHHNKTQSKQAHLISGGRNIWKLKSTPFCKWLVVVLFSVVAHGCFTLLHGNRFFSQKCREPVIALWDQQSSLNTVLRSFCCSSKSNEIWFNTLVCKKLHCRNEHSYAHIRTLILKGNGPILVGMKFLQNDKDFRHLQKNHE